MLQIDKKILLRIEDRGYDGVSFIDRNGECLNIKQFNDALNYIHKNYDNVTSKCIRDVLTWYGTPREILLYTVVNGNYLREADEKPKALSEQEYIDSLVADSEKYSMRVEIVNSLKRFIWGTEK